MAERDVSKGDIAGDLELRLKVTSAAETT